MDKGSVQDFLTIFMELIYTVLLFTTVVVFVAIMIHNSVDVQETSRELLSYNIYYSPNTIWAERPLLDRPDVGVIDFATFTNTRIQSALDYPERHIAARIIATTHDWTAFKNYCDEPPLSEDTKTIYVNKEGFLLYCPLSKLEGKGGAEYTTKLYPVFIKPKEEGGWLLIQTFTSNK